jgi:hypothetical protein
MSKHQTNAINTSATSKQVRESTDRELTENELEHDSPCAKKKPPSLSGESWILSSSFIWFGV